METKTYGRNSNIYGFLIGFGVGVVIALALFSYRAFRGGRNLMDTFMAVRLGTAEEETQQLLQSAGIRCDWRTPASTNPAVCSFSDYTHEYRIVLSAADRKIIRKSFSFRTPKLTN